MADHSIDWDWASSYIMGSKFLYSMFTAVWIAVTACVKIAVISVQIKPT